MEPFLRDLDVWCWRYLENVRNYPGLHLTAKPAACDALLRCLDLIERAPGGARRSVPLRPLAKADEAKITGGQRYECFSTLRLAFRADDPELRYLCVSYEGPVALVEVTPTSIGKLRGGLEDVKHGVGDYSIAPPHGRKELRALGLKDRASLRLWFWPCFGHLWPVE